MFHAVWPGRRAVERTPAATPAASEAIAKASPPRVTPAPRVSSPTPERGPAERMEVVRVPASGRSIPGVELSGLKWRQEVAAKGSPYANMKPGQVLPGKRTPGLEGEPKLFTGRLARLKPRGFVSKAQWRKFFADPVLSRFAHGKAHATKGGAKIRYRRLVERKGGPSAGTAR